MNKNLRLRRSLTATAAALALAAQIGTGLAKADAEGMTMWVDTTGGAWLSPEDCPSACRPLAATNLTDVPVDDYPICQQEDCSDVPNQEGLWQSHDGNWYFEQGEGHTWLIIDNTVDNAYDAGAYVGGYN